MRSLILAFALLPAFSSPAAELIAPPPLLVGASDYSDVMPVSLSNGTNTLVAWVYQMQEAWPTTWSVYFRILEESAPGALLQGAAGSSHGTEPILAANGHEYLVAFSMSTSVWNLNPYANVGVQIVTADGRPGRRRELNVSLRGSAGGATWNGEHWLVGYTTEAGSYVALLDRNLESVATVAVPGSIIDVAMVQRRAWAFVSKASQTEALEILANGTIGERHVVAGGGTEFSNGGRRGLGEVVVTSTGALLFRADSSGVTVMPFDPESGFGTAQQIAPDRVLKDAAPWQDGAAVLLTNASASSAELLAVNGSGRVLGTSVSRTALPRFTEIRLGETKDGLVYFESRRDDGPADIYSYSLPALQLVEPPELISTTNLARQHTARIASNGAMGIAFWTETLADRTEAVHSRAVDANGHPSGEIAILAAIPVIGSITFDGEQFIAVWELGQRIYAATISRDGATPGSPMLLGEGDFPSIASSGGATFVVWRDPSGTVRGTNVRADASPVVPGGSSLLPAFAETTFVPKITAIAEGFFVGYTAADVRTLVLSPHGTVLRGAELGIPGFSLINLASRGISALGAVTFQRSSYLYAFAGDGRPFELADPHWGEWSPRGITPIAENRYLVLIERGDSFFTSEIGMTGAFITAISPLRRFVRTDSLTVVNGTPLGVYIDDGVYVTTGPESGRRRAVRSRR